MQAKLHCAERVAYSRGLLRFLRTRTVPPILWLPADGSPETAQLTTVRPLLLLLPFFSAPVNTPHPQSVLWACNWHTAGGEREGCGVAKRCAGRFVAALGRTRCVIPAVAATPAAFALGSRTRSA